MGKVPDAAAEFTQGYADYLQAPLQPLMDDLGSLTYEVFERDPVKYRQYEEVSPAPIYPVTVSFVIDMVSGYHIGTRRSACRSD